MRCHRGAAARTAIADGKETPQHHLAEEGMMNAAASIFSFKNSACFLLGDPPCQGRVVLQGEAGKWFTYYHAHIEGQAGIIFC